MVSAAKQRLHIAGVSHPNRLHLQLQVLVQLLDDAEAFTGGEVFTATLINWSSEQLQHPGTHCMPSLSVMMCCCLQIRKAVISVPAYFNVKQREATANAGRGIIKVTYLRTPLFFSPRGHLHCCQWVQVNWQVLK